MRRVTLDGLDAATMFDAVYRLWRGANPDTPDADLARRSGLTAPQISLAKAGRPMGLDTLRRVIRGAGLRVQVSIITDKA